MANGGDLDGKDLEIIAALQINGRANYADLAKMVDLSPVSYTHLRAHET